MNVWQLAHETPREQVVSDAQVVFISKAGRMTGRNGTASAVRATKSGGDVEGEGGSTAVGWEQQSGRWSVVDADLRSSAREVKVVQSSSAGLIRQPLPVSASVLIFLRLVSSRLVDLTDDLSDGHASQKVPREDFCCSAIDVTACPTQFTAQSPLVSLTRSIQVAFHFFYVRWYKHYTCQIIWGAGV
ncbi:hypothetical protein BKA80DRAFT_96487 [Phyllosticta citrichinensis]